MRRIIPIIVAAMFLLVACNNKNSDRKSNEQVQIHNAITLLQANPVKISLNKMVCCMPNVDTINDDNVKRKFRLIVYVDSSKCSPCIISRMAIWNDLIDETRDKVKYVFIFEPQTDQIEDSHFAVESSGLKNHIYLDTASVFRKENKYIPKEEKYHTMLINEKDSVVMVGTPLTSPKIESLFYKVLGIEKQ